jgi:hypothetical protein
MANGGDNQDVPPTAAELRERALRARRLARGYLKEADRRTLNEMADELEAKAAALERNRK